ncbi:MAG: UDP-N-acetyl-D-mannosaminuronic acid dehydrogenase [Actinomycetota bacterium]|jgi:UDP-N-acetyl-D-mannosaminuronic acid dehydrogenase|nr:UDP-N-acetyl-D-mannosaminuronic acid dehydrogenase [Actinomycetota bacterium]
MTNGAPTSGIGSHDFDYDVTIIGGCGHVGLPLGIAFADRGLRVALLDVSDAAVETVNSGVLPFMEPGAGDILKRVVADGTLRATTDHAAISSAAFVIVVIGTPVDEHLNPDRRAISRALSPSLAYLRTGQTVVLRSTVYPGVTRQVERMFAEHDINVDVAFCPERIAEGRAMVELFSLPQIVAARTPSARAKAASLFGVLTDTIVDLEPEEAELAKLFTNTWRYIKFAAANQFYSIANDYGLDFERIRTALAQDYPRAADLPGAGFAAGPCLFKDTMQLAAFDKNDFLLGHSAMLINEGLPLYVIDRLERRFDLATMTVGILGMAFKAESDDIRSSLSYKLKKILQFKAESVLCTDPYVTVDPELVPLERVLAESQVLIVGAPHAAYRDLEPTQPVADVWNVLGRGVGI